MYIMNIEEFIFERKNAGVSQPSLWIPEADPVVEFLYFETHNSCILELPWCNIELKHFPIDDVSYTSLQII